MLKSGAIQIEGDVMDEMHTIETVAKRFKVSERTVMRLIERQELRAMRVGRQWRISQEWLDEWVARSTTQTKEDVG